MSAGRTQTPTVRRGELLPAPSVFPTLEIRPGATRLPACRNCRAELPPAPGVSYPSLQMALAIQAEGRGYVLQCPSCRAGYLIRVEQASPIAAGPEKFEADGSQRPEGVWLPLP